MGQGADERRATLLLLALALAGVVVRFMSGGTGAPGAVLVHSHAVAARPSKDSVDAISQRLATPLRRGERIDVDRAGVDDLTRLPRVGPALALRITREREEHGAFGSIEALGRVSGVGPKLLEAIRPHVKFSGAPRSGRVGSSVAAPGSKISLNRASERELVQLPGIGASLAAAIVSDRERNGLYRRLEDLLRVRGIGKATIERIRERVTLP
jgi:competence protein ComEA